VIQALWASCSCLTLEKRFIAKMILKEKINLTYDWIIIEHITFTTTLGLNNKIYMSLILEKVFVTKEENKAEFD